MILRILLYLLAAAVLMATIVVLVGYSLPAEHEARGTARLSASADTVFATITDVARYPEWRQDVSAVDVLSGSPLRWRETSGGDVITFEVVEARPPERFQVRIADDSLPFGGTWTYDIEPDGSGTRLVITEHGIVYNPVFRFMSRFVFGHTATIQRYIAALVARLGAS